MKFFATKISENIHETAEGFLLCMDVSIARTGEMVYGKGETPLETDSSGKIIITRDEAEVFRPETIASFQGKSITIKHPEEFVDPSNWKELTVGTVQNVRRGEGESKDDLVADLMITDALAIGLVKKGLREVSCGYEAEYHQTGDGTGKQTNIVGNHLALVEEGRAGSAYAINDNKNGKGVPRMKLKERIAAMFAKAQDEAAKMVDEEMSTEKKEAKADDASAYDELVKICKDLSGKIEAMGKSKDEEKPEKKEEKKEDESKDEGEESSMEDRLKALELAVQKLMEGESTDEDEEESEDDEDEGEEKSEDADEEEKSDKTGDTAARAEILAPGIKHTKDVKAKALKQAYGTKDGKAIIDALNGGKAPTFDSKEKVDSLFIAASEVFKFSRGEALASTKKTNDFVSNLGVKAGDITPEAMNEINAKHFGLKK